MPYIKPTLMRVLLPVLFLLGLVNISFSQVIQERASCGNPIPIQFTVSITSDYNGQAISCNGDCDGEITVTITGGGGGPYGFEMFDGSATTTQAADTPGGGTVATFQNLCADNYNFTVIDSAQLIFGTIFESCTEFGVIITDPNNIGVNVLGFQDPSCPDSCDGRIFTNIGGGTGALDIEWLESGSTIASPTGVCTGVNTVEVTDANGCFFTQVVDVDDPSQINFGINIQDVTCDGVCDAQITSSPSGSNGGPFNFTWTDEFTSTGIGGASGLPSHTVGSRCENDSILLELEDVNGCPFDTTIRIPDVLPMTMTQGPSIDASCFNVCDGSITIALGGGSGNYIQVEWYEGTIGSPIALHDAGPSLFQNDLCPDTDYFVTVEDDQGCIRSFQLNQITSPPAFVYSMDSTNVTCNGDGDGEIDITLSGGQAPYDFTWTTIVPGSGLIPTDEDQTGLSGGVYQILYVDDNNCRDSAQIEILEPEAIFTNGVVTDVSCFDLTDGSIAVTTTGGNGGYIWTWTSSPNGNIADPSLESQNGLDSAVYFLHIEDQLGCEYDTTFNLNTPDELFFNATITDMLCFGDNDAVISLNPSNGVPAYIIDWGAPINQSNGPTSQSGLSEDSYNITLTDDNGCDKDTIIDIVEPDELILTLNSSSDITCFGDNDGEIDISFTGGTPNVQVVWTGGSTAIPVDDLNPTNLGPGTYTATATDANGCQDALVIDILEPTSLQVSMSGTDLACNGVANGEVDVTASGGVGTIPTDYSYDWDTDVRNDFNDPEDLTGLLAGTYCLNIQDANGCTLAADSCVTIIEPDSIFFNGSIHTDITCNGDDDGTITISVNGGTLGGGSSYNFNWNPVPACASITPTDQNLSGLCEGDYTVTASDDNGCTNDTTFTIIEPLLLELIENSHTDITCFGDNDGEIDLSLNGGTAPVTVVWSGGSTAIPNDELNPTNLGPGTYQACATDANNCNICLSIDIIEPTQLVVDIVGTDLQCNGVADGEVEITASGGVGNIPSDYLYDWSHIGGTNNIEDLTGLLAGTYCVNIQDANGCTLTADSCSTIIEPDSIFFDGSIHTDISCNGVDDGTITISVNGGTIGGGSSYNFNWTPVPACASITPTDQNLSGLCEGDYTVTASDDNGCTNDTTFTIIEPIVVTISESHTNLLCAGINTGDITITVNGGTAPHEVTWTSTTGTTPATNVLNPSGLEPGDYTAFVEDANGCTDFVDITITTPTPLSVLLTGTDVTCNGLDDGTLTLTPSGGTVAGNYTYSWTGPNGFTSTAQNLNGREPGTYCVNIEDDNNCVLTPDSCYTITEPDSIFFDGTLFTDMDCFGADNGAIDITVSGGTVVVPGAYNFNWNITPGCYSGSTTDEDISGLCNGIYEITVSDDNGCTNDTTFTVNEPPAIVIDLDSTDAGCGIDNGTVTVTPSGGTVAGNYGISWTAASDPGFSGTNLTETGLAPDTYSVTITDDNGCSAADNIEVVTINAPTITIDNVTDLLCNSACIGAIQVSITGGVGPYDIQWTGVAPLSYSSSNEDIFSLCAGDYSLNVTDVNLCSSVETVTITEPTPLELTSTTVTDVQCFGADDGSIDIVPAGGVGAAPGDYTYTWSGDNSMNATTQNVSGLAPGNYCVNIEDANGCSFASDSCFVITEPTELVIDALTSTDSQCGVPNGSATVSVSGGTASGGIYTYEWLDGSNNPIGQTTATAGSLLEGAYTVEITDDNGCTVSGSVAVNPTNGPAVTVDGFTHVTCASASNGTIQTTGSGGSGSLTYTWTSIPAGYSNNTPDVFGLPGGTYVVTVTDGALCNSQEVIVIDEPDPINIVAAVTDANCFGELGEINITVTGGTIATDYGYDWDNNGTGSYTDNEDLTAAAGSYSICVVDDNSCTACAGPFVIDEPTQITLSTSSTVSACTQATGSVTVVAADGTPGNPPNEYTYVWTDGSGTQIGNTATVGNLFSGCYDVLVTENRTDGCTASTTECISDNPGPTLSETHINATCNGGNDGSIDLTVTSLVQPVTVVWSSLNGSPISPSINDEDINTLAADEYSVVATDDDGCTAGLSIDITEPVAISITAAISNPTCSSSMDGAIDITVNNAVMPIAVVDWTGPGGFTDVVEDISGLAVGQYCVHIEDDNGCTLDTCITLTAPTGITINTASVDTDCNAPTGQVSAVATGGNPGYTYTWFDDPAMNNPGDLVGTGDTQTGLGFGTYYLLVEDLNGCTATATQDVDESNAPTLTIDAVNDADCFGNSTGDIFVTASGGAGGYTYDWDNLPGANDPEDQTGLPAGTYNVVVTDAVGCSANASADVEEPLLPLSISGSQTDLACSGIADGEVSISVTGGTADYTYEWTESGSLISTATNGTGNNTVTGLSALTYDVLVTDDNGCTITDQYTLTEATVISLVMSNTASSCGNSDGTATVVASGGTDGITYTYSWTDFTTGTPLVPGNLDTQSSLSQGTYQVEVEDLNGCTAIDQVTISDANGPIVTGTTTPVACYGDADGTIDITVSGIPTFDFSWTGPGGFTSTDEDPTGTIEAGTYAVAVTDGNGCVTNELFDVLGPIAPLSVAMDSTDLTCFNDLSGAINITPAGGTSPYQFAWSGPNGFTASTEDLNSLEAGIYTLDLTDDNGCALLGSTIEVVQPDSIEITFATIDPSCGLSDGTVTATVTGGILTSPDYTYSWTDLTGPTLMPDTDADITGISAGNFELTVTDDNGCFTTDIIAVSNDQAPSITVDVTDILCFGDDNGEIDITVNGVNTYTYDWDDNGMTGYTDPEDLSGLSPGVYNVQVLEDPTGCISSATATVSEPDLLEVSGTSTDLTCFGDGSGEIDIDVTGGTTNYTFDWDNLVGTNDPEDQSGLAAGAYQVTVTDANNCVAIDSYTLTEPSQIALTAVLDHNDCFGETDGSIDVTVANGVAPYQYDWDLPSTNEDISNLSAGSYTLTVTDDNGCTEDSTFVITEPSQIIFDATVTDANCNLSDGAITTNVSGGTLTSPDYTYDWEFGGISIATTANISTRPAGTYIFFVTDDNLCEFDTTIIINNINAPQITVDNITDVNCFGENNGSVDVTITLGTAPYTYLWNPNGISQQEDLTGAPAGTYSLQVTDDAGCIVTEPGIVIGEPAEITASSVDTDATCNICNGESVVTGIGGTGNLTYVWSNGNSGTTGSALCAGLYTVQITDDNGCSVNHDIAINDNGGPTGENLTTTDASCAGLNDGTAFVEALGGTAPYTYFWPHDGSTGDTQNTLEAGTYHVEMIDDNGCTRVVPLDILEPTPIDISSIVTPSTCGNSDGAITITTTGGVSPLTINWINPAAGGTNPGVSGLAAGIYTVEVTDDNGCSATENITISDINAPVVNLTPSDVLCFGDATGSVTSTVTGAVGVLSYQWYDATPSAIVPETNPDILNVATGTYTLEVTDAGTGCIANAVTTVEEPDELILSVPNTVDASCDISCDGEATAIVSGGTLGYSYLWTSGSTSATATNLCLGLNTVEITDNNGCIIQTSVMIDTNFTLDGQMVATDATCGDCDGQATIAAVGGSGSYSFEWSTGQTSTTIINLCAGVYAYEITDDVTGCSVQQNATINDIGGPTGETINTTDVTCNGGNDGGATVTPIGGTTPYSYNWIGASNSTNTLSNATAGNYTLQVTDDNGCTRNVPIDILEPASPDVQYIATDGTCGNADGAITIIVTGSNDPYTYLWTGGPSAVGSVNDAESGLLPGIYTIEVTDNSGCTEEISIPLGTTDGPDLTVSSTDETCYGLADGTATVVATGNNPFQYDWDLDGFGDNDDNDAETGFSQGTYFVSVTDALGCVSNESVDINSPDSLVLGLPTVIDASCDIACDGEATVIVTGGTLSYTYTWDGGQTSQTATGLCVGVNNVNITDDNGCQVQTSVNVDFNNTLTSNVSETDAACGVCDGEATVAGAGGSGNYTITWYDGTTGTSHIDLCAGIYPYTLLDNTTGCSTDLEATINNIDGPDNDVVVITDVTCSGGADGSADVTVTGGTLPYTYLWVPTGQTTNTLTNVEAGTYNLEVSDSNDCKRVVPVTIADGNTIDISYLSVGSNCGSSDGSIDLVITGGVTPYTISWSGPGGFSASSLSETGLTAGIYTIDVTDNGGCTESIMIPLSTTNAPTASVTSSDVSCFGVADGSLTAAGVGLDFEWQDGSTNATLGGVSAGEYFVTVTDQGTGCSAVFSGIVNEPDSLALGIQFAADPLCNGDCNGEISAIVDGGTLPYSYTWSSSANTSATELGLCDGVVTLSITDDNGCTTSGDVTLTEPAAISITVDNITDAQCVNSQDGAIDITATGGTGALQYNWVSVPSGFTSSSEDLSNLDPTTYEVTVTDDNGCLATETAIVDTITVVLANAGMDTAFCLNNCAVLTGSYSAPAVPSFEWNSVPTSTILSTEDTVLVCPTTTGITQLTLTVSLLNCSHTDTVNVEMYPLPTVDAGADIEEVLSSTVTLGGSPTGPTGSTYFWNPSTNFITPNDTSASNPDIELLEELDYVVFVTDTNGCVNSDTIHVRPIPQIVFPNGFTPNGDGINDDWQIDYIEQFPESVVEVYNRWGEMLFRSVGYTDRWDGTFNGKDLPVGTYYYIIELNDPLFPDTYSGPLTIMR